MHGKESRKLQTAMEYLMTYGWAILIIAVVLVALFQMGVFNSANFAPKAQPGSCQVFKTVAATSLEGTCNNELPQYVAQFNGASSYISTRTVGLPLGSTADSVLAWIYFTGGSSGYYTIHQYGTGDVGTESRAILTHNNELYFSGAGDDYQFTLSIPLNTWVFVGYTYNGGNTIVGYVNGVSQSGTIGSQLNTVLPPSNPAVIGAINKVSGSQLFQFFQGSISNVQIYNTSLSANDVAALYYEGIGGAPQNTQNLVGWWPLNGNANDYSGNNNNGAATNVIYTGSWTSGYSAP